MAATKVRTSLFSAITLTAGAASLNSSWIDLSAGFSATINAEITNGTAGPSLPSQVQVQTANNYNGGAPTLPINSGGALVAGVANDEVTPFGPILIVFPVQAVRLVAGSNTDENTTISADISQVTAVS